MNNNKKRNEWSNEFNSLPFKTRTIACAVLNELQINGLKREKKRLISRYKQSLKEINSHIKNLEDWYNKNYTQEVK